MDCMLCGSHNMLTDRKGNGACCHAGENAISLGDISPLCGHFACDVCLREWIAHQISWHVPPARLRCFHEGYLCELPAALIQKFVHECVGPCQAPHDLGSQLKIEMLRRRDVPANLIVLSSIFFGKPLCPVCHTEVAVLVANDGCYHAACLDCWENEIEREALLARNLGRRALSATCLEPNCTHDIGHHILIISPMCSSFIQDVASELNRLKRTADGLLIYGDNEHGDGPECSVCHTHAFGLLQNPGCGHGACEHCWAHWAEEHIQNCQTKCLPQLYAPCIHRECSHMMSKGVVRHACTLSKPVLQFTNDMDAEVARMEKTASDILVWGSAQSGPTCMFCDKLCLTLLGNAECCHMACEECWARWAESQVPSSHDQAEL